MSNWANQAALASLLKYRPQREGLADIQRAAEEKYKAEVQAGRTEGLLGQNAARQAKPEVEGIYNSAEKGAQRTRSLLAPTLESLSATNPFRLAAQNEEASGTERLGKERARAVSDVHQRGVAASELPAYAQQAALATLAKELTAVHSKGSALSASEGAETVNQLNKLEGEQRKEKLTERGQNLTYKSAKEGREQQKYEHEHPTPKIGKGNYLSQEKQTAAASHARTLENLARGYWKGGASPQEIKQLLSTEHPEESVEKLKNGKPVIGANGKPVMEKVPKQAAYAPDVLMEAAIESVTHSGAVSKATLSKLHEAGYSVKALGFAVQKPQKAKPVKTIGPRRRPA